MTSGLSDKQESQNNALSIFIFVAATAVMGMLRLYIFSDRIVALSYVLPMLICLWHRDLRLLWAMAVTFIGMSAFKAFVLLPRDEYPLPEIFLQWTMHVVNIGITAVVIHKIVRLTESLKEQNVLLEQANNELSAREEEITRQNEELHSQSEEMAQQNEELQQQSEELSQQTEELHSQSEELQVANSELKHREAILQKILRSLESFSNEGEMLDAICGALPEMLGGGIAAAALLENSDGVLRIQAYSGLLNPNGATWPFNKTFSELVISQARTAFIADLNLRPDLFIPPHARGFKSVLATPLYVGGKIGGTIEVYSVEPRQWTERQFGILEWVAAQCSLVLQILRLRAMLTQAKTVAELANQQKDQFMAMLGHELRNPLAPIRNAVAVLDRLAPPDPKMKKSFEIISRQVNHLKRLVDDLLDVSRIARGKVSLKEDNVKLTEIVQCAIEDHRPVCEAAGLHLSISVPSEPLWIHGDAARITQILGNILANAIKFTDRGGSVSCSLESHEKSAVLKISDSGIGMGPEILSRIFEPFSQADGSIERSRGGLGLGLALAKALIELHGGTISATSEGLGKGSTIICTFPTIAAPHQAVLTSQPVAQTQTRGCNVLLIEDNRDAAETLQIYMEMLGHSVILAENGSSGVALARQHAPDFILCDIGLPGMDGFEVARALRGDPKLSTAKLIALTGYGQAEDRERALRAGFHHHLVKPADLDDLQKLLRSHSLEN